jgi:hypothetical protein
MLAQEAGQLPQKGKLVTDEAEAAAMLAAAARQEIQISDGPASWHENVLYGSQS